MAARTLAQVAPTADTIALNAYIYGYGGHSLVTPHAALKLLWWTEERINLKVDRAFVLSKLRGQERDFLDQTVGFGEAGGVKRDAESVDVLGSLTNETYLSWILTRARRLFLILTEVGVPDQIFGCIDDLWDDDDLPLTMDSIKKMELTIDDDPVLEKKVYDTQFIYLLRELKKGNHIDYDSREHIPLEHVDQIPPAVSVQEYGGRVHFPARPDQVFMRRKIILREKGSEENDMEIFKQDVLHAQALAHPNIAPVFASYTSGDAGFVLSNFVVEHTLATFCDHRTPPSFMRVSASKRPVLLQQWMLSLADALAYLHDNAEAHTAICPSNIWIDRDNHIVFADLGSLITFRKAKKINNTELYDYAAPESISRQGPPSIFDSPAVNPASKANDVLRKASIGRKSASSISKAAKGATAEPSYMARQSSTAAIRDNTRSEKVDEIGSTVHRTGRFDFTQKLPSTVIVPTIFAPEQTTAFASDTSRHTSSTQLTAGSASQSLVNVPSVVEPSPAPQSDASSSSNLFDPNQADIFALACIYLNIITFMVEGKLTEFVRFRSYALNAFKQRRYRTDQSFHSDADILSNWITHLGTACEGKIASEETAGTKESVAVWKKVPALLDLVGRMLNHDAASRPPADEVQRTIENILKTDDRQTSSSTASIPLPIRGSSDASSDRISSSEHMSGGSDTTQSSMEAAGNIRRSGEADASAGTDVMSQSSAIEDEDDTTNPEFASPGLSKFGNFRRFSLVSVLAGSGGNRVAPLSNVNGRENMGSNASLGFRSVVDLPRPATGVKKDTAESSPNSLLISATTKSNPPSKLMRMQVMDDVKPPKAHKTKTGGGGLRSLKSIFTRSSKMTAQAS
jgi:serine/threonine protein kinase